MSETPQAVALPKRSDVAEEHRWNRADIYPNLETWEKDFELSEAGIPELAKFQGTLAESPAQTAACFRLADEIGERFEKLIVYAFMYRDEDTTDQTAQSLFDRAQRLAVQLSTAGSFVEPELLQMDEERIAAYLDSEELAPYRHRLENIVRSKPHSLSPQEEAILAAAGEMAQAPSNVFGMFNNADLKFGTIKDEEGNDVEVTHGRYSRFIESKDRRVRKDAFFAMHEAYGKWRNTLAATYSASVRKDVFYARTRKYDSALHQAVHSDNVPVEVYTNLIESIHSRLDLLHRYVDVRKKLLGLDDIHFYDMYVPVVQELDMKIPYDEGADMMLRSMAPLGDDYVAAVKQGLENRWVDIFENKGKRSGAYSISAYGAHPYILMNYEPNLDNVFTLAHEFGHAIHSHLANETQPYHYANYTIFVAEVASTLNEHLLFHHLLQETTSPDHRRYLINKYLDTIRGTVFRQVQFAEFEMLTHAHVEQGQALTPQWLSDTYYELVKKYYGPGMVADEAIAMEWARIPHFYRAFYVYKYATGFAAATALGQAVLDEGQPAVDRYLNMLRGGGSDYPLNLLKNAGVDMTTPEPIMQVMNVFETLLNELEALG